MKVQEIIDLVNKEPLYSLWDAEDVIGGKAKQVASGLKLDEHRWYSTAVDVYQCDDGFVGVWGAYQSFSEMQTWQDIDIVCEASKYKEVQSVTYEPE